MTFFQRAADEASEEALRGLRWLLREGKAAGSRVDLMWGYPFTEHVGERQKVSRAA